jgi:hypothetical protein
MEAGTHHTGVEASGRFALSSTSLTLLVRLLMAQRMRRMSIACHMSSPKTALHFFTTSPTWIRWQLAAGEPSLMFWTMI